MTDVFNNREISIFIWLLVVLFVIIADRNTRYPFIDVLKSFTDRKILAVLGFMFLYIILLTSSLYYLRIWNFSLLKETIYWIGGVAFIHLFRINKARESENFFKTILIDNFKLIIILEFVTNLYVFNLLAELILLPIVTFLMLMSVYSEMKHEHKKVKIFTDSLIALYGAIVVIYSVHHISLDLNNFATLQNLKILLLSPILTILFIPFIYFTALYMAYELFFVRIKVNLEQDNRIFRNIKKKALYLCYWDLNKVLLISKKLRVYRTKPEKEIINDMKAILRK